MGRGQLPAGKMPVLRGPCLHRWLPGPCLIFQARSAGIRDKMTCPGPAAGAGRGSVWSWLCENGTPHTTGSPECPAGQAPSGKGLRLALFSRRWKGSSLSSTRALSLFPSHFQHHLPQDTVAMVRGGSGMSLCCPSPGRLYQGRAPAPVSRADAPCPPRVQLMPPGPGIRFQWGLPHGSSQLCHCCKV